jgi:hypothetical protein
MRDVMNQKKYIVIAVTAIATTVLGYNTNHGPFPDDAKVERVNLVELKYSPGEADLSHPKYTFPIPNQKESKLDLVRKSDAWFAELTVNGKTVLQPTAYSPYGTVGGMMAYTADLNQDRADDYVIYSYSGGCGLACGHCNVAFILSSGTNYTLTTVTTLFPDESDFIIVDKKPYFIHTSFLGVDECNDGRNHNFWIYNLLAFGKSEVSVASTAHTAFPKTIWYTFKPNHTETTIITNEQTTTLQKQSLTCIYWKEEDS